MVQKAGGIPPECTLIAWQSSIPPVHGLDGLVSSCWKLQSPTVAKMLSHRISKQGQAGALYVSQLRLLRKRHSRICIFNKFFSMRARACTAALMLFLCQLTNGSAASWTPSSFPDPGNNLAACGRSGVVTGHSRVCVSFGAHSTWHVPEALYLPLPRQLRCCWANLPCARTSRRHAAVGTEPHHMSCRILTACCPAAAGMWWKASFRYVADSNERHSTMP